MLDAQDANRGKVLSIVFRADSIEDEDSIDEVIKALASELDKNTCKRLLRISDWFWLLLTVLPMLDEVGNVLTFAAPESSIKQK